MSRDNPAQRIVIFAGPDMTGKSNIAKELSRQINVPYFKASSEHQTFLHDQDEFLLQLQHADPRLLDFLKQTGASAIFDRAYPCEWVYSQLLGRDTDFEVLEHLDDEYAKLDARLIICVRKNYDGIVDDIQPKFGPKVLMQQDELYQNFEIWTKLRTMVLYTDDEDLTQQVKEIRYFLGW
jgi:hypothetical protein